MTPIRPKHRPALYRVDLSLAWVEALEQGRCPESLATFAHELLAWRRAAIRATTTKPRRRTAPTKKKKFVTEGVRAPWPRNA